MKKERAIGKTDFSDLEIMRFILKTLYGGDREQLTLRLIEKFGGAAGVFDASQSELMRVEGVTERVASFFAFVKPLYRQALLRSAPEFKIVCEADLARYAAVYFMNDRVALDVCLYLDKRGGIISVDILIGEDRTAEILSGVCRYDATSVALLRFVPHENDVSASRTLDRLETVKRLLPSLELIDARLVDYVEYFPFGFISLRRALGGNDTPVAVQAASLAEYDLSAGIFSDIDGYISVIKNRIAEKYAR